MRKKPIFDPVVTRIKLNPEQAVLACGCYSNRMYYSNGARNFSANVCTQNTRRQSFQCNKGSGSTVS